MTADSTHVELYLEAGDDADAREIDELTSKLRRELIQLDVDSVERAVMGEAPPGTRGMDVLALGTLVVELAKSSQVIRSLVESVRGWLSRQPERSVKLQIDNDILEVTGASSADQERLIAAWIDRHAR